MIARANLVFDQQVDHFRTMEQTTAAPAKPPMKAGIVPVTPLQQNCSLIWCTATNKGALIDPGGDLDKLKAAAEELEKSSHKLAEALYQKAQKEQAAGGGADAAAGANGSGDGAGDDADGPDDDNVVDADFEEVKPS